MQLKNIYIKGKTLLHQAGVSEPAIEAASLLCSAVGLNKMSIFSNPQMQLNEDSVSKFNEFINRRIKGEPNSYITGVKEFYSREFIVSRDVLIPRAETELVVDEALKVITGSGEYFVADICAGSGCIGIALASMKKNVSLISTDISFSAVQVANKNAKLNRVASRSVFLNANFTDCIEDGSVDLVVCNPPYVATGDLMGLQDEIRDHEPERALAGGEDGLFHIREVVRRSKKKLKNGGWLIMEIGIGQCRSVMELLKLEGYDRLDVTLDMCNIERVIKAQWKRF